MDVIPAIDIRDGQCVQLIGGQPATGSTHGDPLAALSWWEQAGATRVHVVDLDAAMNSGTNRALVERLLEAASVPTHVGGGIRDVDTARSLLEAGASRIVLGTVAVADTDLATTILEEVGSDRVLVALEPRDDGLAVDGWTGTVDVDLLDVARYYEDRDVGGFLFTNVEREGRLEGIDPGPIAELVEAVSAPVYAAGGVATLDDVTAAARAGAAGVVVGTALYAGRFTLQAAMEAQP